MKTEVAVTQKWYNRTWREQKTFKFSRKVKRLAKHTGLLYSSDCTMWFMELWQWPLLLQTHTQCNMHWGVLWVFSAAEVGKFMIIHSLIHNGGKSASFCICCITKRFQKAWTACTRLQVKQHKYRIVNMRLLQVLK